MPVFVCVAVALVAGCTQSRGASVKQLCLAELERETAGLVDFDYVRVEDSFDDFTTPDERRFRVSAAELGMPRRSLPPQWRQAVRPGDGVALFVKLKDGRWVPPDPDKMRALFPDVEAGHE
jgi:hypothetical protein